MGVLILMGVSFLALAFALFPADHTSANPSRTGGGCGGCHPVTSTPFTTVTGFPSGTYVPNMNYSVTVSVADTSTSGDNHFNFIVTAGTLGTLDPDTRVVSSTQVAAQNTLTNSWSFYWVAPVSGSVTADVYAVDGSGAGRDDPHERITFGTVEIPEFGVVVIPIAGILGMLVLASRAKRR